jgi:hypothetical protein
MELTIDKLNEISKQVALGESAAKNDAKLTMPYYITLFRIALFDYFAKTENIWDVTKKSEGNIGESMAAAKKVIWYGMAALNCLPVELKETDGKTAYPLESTLQALLGLYNEFKDVPADLIDFIELIGTDCELGQDKSMSMLSEFAVALVIIGKIEYKPIDEILAAK